MTLEDAPEFFSLRSNPEAMKHICKPLQTSLKEAENMILKMDAMIDSNNGINWGICFKDEPAFIGTVSFHRVDKEHYRAEIGYMLKPVHWKKGIISEAVAAIIDHGFDKMKLHSIEAQIDPTNTGSEKTLQKFNFVKEAYYKENYFFDGVFLDTVVYSLLSPCK